MSIPTELRERVRRRAGFACEYCGVTETDVAGQLTIDHFHPQAKGGSDAVDNLVYCCHRCNEYKSDYWAQESNVLSLWNPRQEPAEAHLMELADGKLLAITETGVLTLNRLRLNRPPLVANRLKRQRNAEEQRLLTHLRDVLTVLDQMQAQNNLLSKENHTFARAAPGPAPTAERTGLRRIGALSSRPATPARAPTSSPSSPRKRIEMSA